MTKAKAKRPPKKGRVTAEQWRVLNRLVFDRDDWRCVLCGKIKPLQAHHVLPRSQGGQDRLDNLVSLDDACHRHMSGGGWKRHTMYFKTYLLTVKRHG